MGAADRLPGENAQFGIAAALVQRDEEALVRDQRDVRMVDDEQVVLFDELFEGMIGKSLQRSGRPLDGDIIRGPAPRT
jgi:hypothetical protein